MQGELLVAAAISTKLVEVDQSECCDVMKKNKKLLAREMEFIRQIKIDRICNAYHIPRCAAFEFIDDGFINLQFLRPGP